MRLNRRPARVRLATRSRGSPSRRRHESVRDGAAAGCAREQVKQREFEGAPDRRKQLWSAEPLAHRAAEAKQLKRHHAPFDRRARGIELGTSLREGFRMKVRQRAQLANAVDTGRGGKRPRVRITIPAAVRITIPAAAAPAQRTAALHLGRQQQEHTFASFQRRTSRERQRGGQREAKWTQPRRSAQPNASGAGTEGRGRGSVYGPRHGARHGAGSPHRVLWKAVEELEAELLDTTRSLEQERVSSAMDEHSADWY